MSNIVVFGDSVTLGAWDSEGGWVARVRRHFDKKFIERDGYSRSYVDIYNLGVDADRAERVLTRLDAELNTKRVEERSDIVVFDVGTNDTHFKNGEYTSTPEKFAGDIRKMSDIAKKYVDNVIFINILPCDDELTQPVIFNDEVYWYSDRINEFNKVLESFCHDNGVELIDVATPFAHEMANKKLLADGIHPNDDGHKLVAKIVLEKLKEMLE